MPDTERAAMRPREEIEAEQNHLQEVLEQVLARGYRGEAYTRGQLAAVGWVLGEETVSPLSEQTGVDASDPRVIDSEWALSERMLRREIPMDRRGQKYVVGVEHALMWVLHQTDDSLV
jgi:hypothetical protein